MTAAELRARLGHPVVDADGHLLEFLPGIVDAIRDEAGAAGADRFREVLAGGAAYSPLAQSPPQESRNPRGPWWGFPTRNTRDRATASLPALLYERLDELGIDFGVVYPTVGLFFAHGFADRDLRTAVCRATNAFHAEVFGPLSERLTPAAVVPMHDPEEAIECLDHAVGLGLKAILIPSYVMRPIPALVERDAATAALFPWLDTYGIDSPHDYDPFWRRCVELGVSPSAHSPGNVGPFGARRSISNMVYNHIGHFAESAEALCKSLFLGGVTRRFPSLRVGLLEGGVSWAVRVYGDLVAHWEKRNLAALANVDPANLDRAALADYVQRYGGSMLSRHSVGDAVEAFAGMAGVADRRDAFPLDEFARVGIERGEDIRDAFVESFYFGCEADDPLTSLAFARTNPFGARLRPMFGSDIGHFDVVEMAQVLPEAYELVERGALDDEEFRAFVFTNVVRFYGPDFFRGTRVEAAAAASGAHAAVSQVGEADEVA